MLMLIPAVLKAQESYKYNKGEKLKVVYTISNIGAYNSLSTEGNRVLIDGRWRYFQGDSVVLYRVPCQNHIIEVITGAASGSDSRYSNCPLNIVHNYNDSTACFIFLNRSASLEQ
jgi:hypothetical protein